jgi:hypothetical protein
MMLCDFNFQDEIILYRYNNSFVNSSYSNNELIEYKQFIKSEISFLQKFLSFWVLTFLCEEIRQV